MSHRVEKVAPSVLQVILSPSLTVCSCITNDNQITVSLVREEKIELRGQSILRKHQILCNIAEVETLKKYLSLLEYFQMYHVFTRENEKTETNPFTNSQVASTGSSDPGRRKSHWWNNAGSLQRKRGVNCLIRKGLWHAIELQSDLQERRQRL